MSRAEAQAAVDRAVALVEGGKSVAEAAREAGCTNAAVHQRLRVAPRQAQRAAGEDHPLARAVAMVKAGATYEAAAEATGVSERSLAVSIGGWKARRATEEELAKLHPSVRAVSATARTAERNGWMAPVSARKKRACICCRGEFLSFGPGNRMCDHCRNASAGGVDLSPYAVAR